MSVRARPTAGRASSRGISLLELALGLAVLGILLIVGAGLAATLLRARALAAPKDLEPDRHE